MKDKETKPHNRCPSCGRHPGHLYRQAYIIYLGGEWRRYKTEEWWRCPFCHHGFLPEELREMGVTSE